MKSFYLDLSSGRRLDAPDPERPCLGVMLPEPDLRVPEQRERPAVLILGGGGFDHLSPREMEPVALPFMAAGAVGFTLLYSRIPSRYPAQLLETARSVAYIREHAGEFHVDPHQILLCGLSAGGHPAASLAVYSTGENCPRPLPEGCAPDGLILGYPLLELGPYGNTAAAKNLLGEKYNDPAVLDETTLCKHVHGNMPPVFLWHTAPDEQLPVLGALRFVQALLEQRVPCEFHLYAEGCHGLSLARDFTALSPEMVVPACGEWIAAAVRWMDQRKKRRGFPCN